jgi:hypothetical protein
MLSGRWKHRVSRTYGELGVGAARGVEMMEASYTVSGAKVADFHADGGDCAGAVVALVELDVEAVWPSLALVRGHWDVR